MEKTRFPPLKTWNTSLITSWMAWDALVTSLAPLVKPLKRLLDADPEANREYMEKAVMHNAALIAAE